MKSDKDVRLVVEKHQRWIDRLTSAESLLIPAVPAALVWAITADQQARETALHPFRIPWAEYGTEGWTALTVWFVLLAALNAAFVARQWHMRRLVAITKGHRMEKTSRFTTNDSAYRRKRLLRDLTFAPPLLWFLSVAALPMPAVWQIGALILGTWVAWEWRAVEKVEAPSIQRMYESAREAAQEKWVHESFGG